MHNLKTYRVFGNERYKSVCLLHRLEMYFWQCCNELLIQEESRQIDSYCEATTATGNPRISLMNKFSYFLYLNIKLYKLLFNWKVNRKHHLFPNKLYIDISWGNLLTVINLSLIYVNHFICYRWVQFVFLHISVISWRIFDFLTPMWPSGPCAQKLFWAKNAQMPTCSVNQEKSIVILSN